MPTVTEIEHRTMLLSRRAEIESKHKPLTIWNSTERCGKRFECSKCLAGGHHQAS